MEGKREKGRKGGRVGRKKKGGEEERKEIMKGGAKEEGREKEWRNKGMEGG
jgi:hypothetical protein